MKLIPLGKVEQKRFIPKKKAVYSWLKEDNLYKSVGSDRTVVMTGQQPGLFGGPLFTLCKAIQTIKTAEHLTQIYSATFTPHFWVESSDDDIEEICSVWTPLGSISLSQEIPKAPLSRIELSQIDTESLILRFSELLPDTEHKKAVLELISDTKEESSTLSFWFSNILKRLLGKRLTIIEPESCEMRDRAKEIFEEELRHPLLTTSLVNREGEEMKRRGMKPQLHKNPNQTSLFILEDSRRYPLFYKDGRFFTERAEYTESDLLSLLKESPDRFSPNVALRLILADSIFKPAIHIMGPSELSYYLQLRGVYERYKLFQPPAVLRTAITIVEPKALRIVRRHRIRIEELLLKEEELIKAMIKRGLDTEKIDRSLTLLTDAISELKANRQMEQYCERSRKRIVDEVSWLKKKVEKVAKDEQKRLVQDIYSLKAQIEPSGTLQERKVNIFWFLARYGLCFIDRLFEALPLDYKHHYYLSVEK
jgi:bacillithiol biosynthesis cysteine-adding enzyme BshC